MQSRAIGPAILCRPVWPDHSSLVELLGLNADVLFAGLTLLPVLAHPRFVTLAGGSIATAEGERGDIGVRDIQLLVRIRRIDTNHGVRKRFAGAAIENVSVDFVAVLQSDGNVAAVVECFFERFAGLFLRSELRDPAFQVLVLRSGSDLERVGFFSRKMCVLRDAHARVSCSAGSSIFTSGL